MSSPPLSYRFMLLLAGGGGGGGGEKKSDELKPNTEHTEYKKNVIFHTYEKQQATLSWHIIIRWQHFSVCAHSTSDKCLSPRCCRSPSSTFSFHVLDVSGMIYFHNYFGFVVAEHHPRSGKKQEVVEWANPPSWWWLWWWWCWSLKPASEIISFIFALFPVHDKALIDSSAMSDQIKHRSLPKPREREKKCWFAVRK